MKTLKYFSLTAVAIILITVALTGIYSLLLVTAVPVAVFAIIDETQKSERKAFKRTKAKIASMAKAGKQALTTQKEPLIN